MVQTVGQLNIVLKSYGVVNLVNKNESGVKSVTLASPPLIFLT